MNYANSLSCPSRVRMNRDNVCPRLTKAGRFIYRNFGRGTLNIVLKIERFLSYKK